jgi:hypothetical protein
MPLERWIVLQQYETLLILVIFIHVLSFFLLLSPGFFF